MKKHIITIAGRPGSGKSTTAKTVAEKLGYHHFSSGDFFREIAREQNIELMEANLTAEKNAEIDHLVDERLQYLGDREDQLVIDSRLAWHWIPASFKVFLDLDLNIAAERIINNIVARKLDNESVPKNAAEYAKVLQNRLDSEARRYKTHYNVDPYDFKNYDLVLNTATNDIEQTVHMVLKAFDEWLNE